MSHRWHCDFPVLRYGLCWEDADVLADALDVGPDDTCLSIAAAGDNTLALLAGAPRRVVAVDTSPAQCASLALRVAAYRELPREATLELLGLSPSQRRLALYARCRSQLDAGERRYWDTNGALLESGFATHGRFERYLDLFRTRLLPLAEPRSRIRRMLDGASRDERAWLFDRCWDNWRWRTLVRAFFSRRVSGRLGRDRSQYAQVEGPVSARLLARARRAFVDLDPAENPYLQWMLTGTYMSALPFALRPGPYEAIREHLDRLSWQVSSLEDHLQQVPSGSLTRCNLSDVFEYVGPAAHTRILGDFVRALAPGGRLVYWNFLVPRTRPAELAAELVPQPALARALHRRDKAFFYERLVIEDRGGGSRTRTHCVTPTNWH